MQHKVCPEINTWSLLPEKKNPPPFFCFLLCNVQFTTRQEVLFACGSSSVFADLLCSRVQQLDGKKQLLHSSLLHLEEQQKQFRDTQAKSCRALVWNSYKLQANLSICDLTTQRFTNWVTTSLSVTTQMTKAKIKGRRRALQVRLSEDARGA